MQNIAPEILAEIAALSVSSSSPEEYELAATRLTEDAVLARRALDWLPEAFGMMLAKHVESSLQLPLTFFARDSAGAWVEVPLAADPVFAQCIWLAAHVLHNGPRDVFERLAMASSVMAVVNKALNQGTSLSGGKLQPLRMLGLSADSYRGI